MDRREAVLKKAADLVQAHADSGCATDPKPMSEAVKAARAAGISLQEIADYNRARIRQHH
ncbi:hypothetical protein SLUN_19460 [Streptomyces lunaelactis]|uniref:Uncharacterized protein n=1 Tax=Streptomyces lunaelactis TaxID=1535768 RepID=A0A2R4T4F6_9ACTN|nr:hypothetical protein [Streptomyces lunaelactis]AVZ74015.1 hypothetical protein SLUN_19460 [Streptomyces lunaelactis]NUK85179.1 hypothetical protein [Streptomyces lunaelactis]